MNGYSLHRLTHSLIQRARVLQSSDGIFHHFKRFRDRKKRLIRASEALLLLPRLLRLVMILPAEDLIDLVAAVTAATGEERRGRVVAAEDVERPDDERRKGLGVDGL
jgi:hypothetical protein